jgi:SPP1 gp7 family putative phage head morphogenesis protein
MADAVQPFAVQFQEAIDFLKGKLPEGSLAWDSLAGPVHAKVFATAGLTRASFVGELQASLVQALQQGQTITAFRKDFDRVVAASGWAYKGKRGWRTSVIFDNNMRSASMAGRWAQVQANEAAGSAMIGTYRTAGDARVRPQHRQWDGLTYPSGDSFWDTHFPPNGWGCRCTVRWYTGDQAERKGIKTSKPFKLQTRDVVNVDGEITDRVPVGIDPGWDHNVGKSWIDPEVALGRKLASLPPELRGRLVDKTISPAFQAAMTENWKAFQTQVQSAGVPTGEAQVVSFLDSATLDAMASRVPGVVIESNTVAVFDAQLAKLAKGAEQGASGWPQALLDDLPGALRNYRAALWDTVDERLVVVPQGVPAGPGQVATAIIKPNASTRLGVAMSLQELGAASVSELGNLGRYQVLVGRIR